MARERLGPSFVTVVEDLDTIGRGPLVVPA